jgi:hypothetical protein
MKSRPPTDTRKQQREFGRSLLWMTLGVLIIGGFLLLAAAYGTGEALIGAICLLGGGGMILLLWLILTLIGKWVGQD